MADEPHPQAQALLQTAAALPFPPTYALSVESARQRLETFMGERPVEDVANTENFSIPGPETTDRSIPVRVYEPDADPPYPVVVYLHGGGWTAGGLDTHDNVCAALTNRADCLTVSVDYRLAPEHPFPAALEDSFAAVEWVAENGGRINADPDRLAVAGDSAGGNLTAAVALMARDHGGPDIAHQGLIYPAVGSPVVHDFASYEENAEGYFLETASTEWYYDNYVQSPVHARNEYLAPLLAADHGDLPPATVVTAGFDPLRDEGVEYAETLTDAGVPVDHHHYEGMIHAFVSLPDMMDDGMDAIEALAADVQTAWE